MPLLYSMIPAEIKITVPVSGIGELSCLKYAEAFIYLCFSQVWSYMAELHVPGKCRCIPSYRSLYVTRQVHRTLVEDYLPERPRTCASNLS